MASIVPTLTAETPEQYAEQIDAVRPFAKRVHIDTCDGVFAPNRLLGLSQVYDIEGVPIDLHLMVERPQSQTEHIVALQPELVIMHFESEVDHAAFAAQLRSHGIRVGLAIKAETTIEQVKELLPKIDHLLVFTGSKLGFNGGKFQAECLAKVAEARAINADLEISVDGGIDATTARRAIQAGVDVLDCGSAIQKAEDPAAAYRTLVAVAEEVA